MIKAVLLLSALSLCGQNNSLATDEYIEKRGCKRKAQETIQTVTSLKKQHIQGREISGIPNDVIGHIFQSFDLSEDLSTLLAISTSCKEFKGIIQKRYTDANSIEHHYPWQDNLSLNPSTIYILNSHMQTILGLYYNIHSYNNMAGNVDRIRFERLCSKFVKTSLFSPTSVPVMYVDFLQLSLGCTDPTCFQKPFINPLQKLLETKKQNCIYELSKIASQQNPMFQNEGALYFHLYKFSSNSPFNQITTLQNTPLFRQLNGSLMRVMDQKLLSLKATPGLSNTGDFSDTWGEIIRLESAVTVHQLDNAASSYYQVGLNATDPAVKVVNFSKAAEYHEEQLKAMKTAGLSLVATDYNKISSVYYNIGLNAMDPAVKVAKFSKAAEYLEEQLKAMKTAGQSPVATDYHKIASVYYQVGLNATDPAVKVANFSKAVEYFQTSLNEGVIGELAQKIQESLEQISIYFRDLKGVEGKN